MLLQNNFNRLEFSRFPYLQMGCNLLTKPFCGQRGGFEIENTITFFAEKRISNIMKSCFFSFLKKAKNKARKENLNLKWVVTRNRIGFNGLVEATMIMSFPRLRGLRQNFTKFNLI